MIGQFGRAARHSISGVCILRREPSQVSPHDQTFCNSRADSPLLDSVQLILPALAGSPDRQSAASVPLFSSQPKSASRLAIKNPRLLSAKGERHSLLGLHLRQFALESSALPQAAKSSMITCGPGQMSRWSTPAAQVLRAARRFLLPVCPGSADLFNYPTHG